jgi:CheY-like chemotaxis protein
MPRSFVILLVDDSPDTLEMYALGLDFAGYRVLTASNAEAALGQLERERPAAVVTDLLLAGSRGGWDLIEEIKRDPATRDIPVVVLTGHTDPSIDATGRRIGCVAVLTKPCLPEELANVLRQILPAAA